jgi:hypothetical protein
VAVVVECKQAVVEDNIPLHMLAGVRMSIASDPRDLREQESTYVEEDKVVLEEDNILPVEDIHLDHDKHQVVVAEGNNPGPMVEDYTAVSP